MNFKCAKDTYRKNAIVQNIMAQKLCFYIGKFFGKNFNNIFEIGAGTGFLTDEIYKNLKFEKLFLNDLTPNYTGHIPFKYVEGDVTQADLPDNIDLIASNAVFQWIKDYDTLFEKIKKSLTPKGLIAFSSFGPDNFLQIKNITGYGLEYVNFEEILNAKGYAILNYEQELHTLYFENVKKVLEHIKSTGVTTYKGALWTPHKFEEFKNKYISLYKDANGLELTYHPVYIIAKLKNIAR